MKEGVSTRTDIAWKQNDTLSATLTDKNTKLTLFVNEQPYHFYT